MTDPEQPDAPRTSVYEALEAFRAVLDADGAGYRITVRTALKNTEGDVIGPVITYEAVAWSDIHEAGQ